MQILPNVFLASGFAFGNHPNSYAVKVGDAAAMIDSDVRACATMESVPANCAAWGLELSQISHLLVTHPHFDHASNAAQLQQAGLKVVCSAGCAEAMACGDDRCIGYAVHREFDPCQADRIVGDGEVLDLGEFTIRPIAAPGHADSCMIYEVVLDGQCVWFTGDVILTGGSVHEVHTGWKGGPDYDRPTYLETLRKLCHMDCDVLCPGHGPPRIGGGKELLEAAYTKAMIEWR